MAARRPGFRQPGRIRCANLNRDLEDVDADLFLGVQRWLRLRGKTTRPKLSEEQKTQLMTCFDLMDANGSGAIDAAELQDAFALLNLTFTRAEIQGLLDEVDHDESGECEYPEFVEIMTISLDRIRNEQERSGEAQGPDVSFELMATAYRRKRLIEGLMSSNRDVQNQILHMATHQLGDAKGGDAEGAAAERAAGGDGARGAHRAAGDTRAGRPWEALLAGLGPEERRAARGLAPVATGGCAAAPAVATGDLDELAALARSGLPAGRALRKPTRAALLTSMDAELRPMQYGFRRMKGRLQLPGLNRRCCQIPQMRFKESGDNAAAQMARRAEPEDAREAFEVPEVAPKRYGPRATIRVQGHASASMVSA